MQRILVKLFVVLTLTVSVVLVPLDSMRTVGQSEAAAAERWIDVDLSDQTATAYVGWTPVYVASVSTGKPGWQTPTGTFYIWRRVYN